MNVVIYRGEWPLPEIDPGEPVATAPPIAPGAEPARAVELELDPLAVIRLQTHGAHVLSANPWAREYRGGVLAGVPWEPQPDPEVNPEAKPRA